jgi:hypothetical protein
MPPVPAGVILESGALTPRERGDGLLLRLRVIPLDLAVFSLPARTVTGENAVFEIPALRIPVLAAPAAKIAPDDTAPSAVPAAPGTAVPGTAAPDDAAGVIPFPPFKPPRMPLPKSLAASCETLYAKANALWDAGRRAGALAELRRNERDHPAGPLFGALRREAEKSLGLNHTADEKWRPGKPLLGFCLACFLIGLLAAALSGGRKRRLVFAVFFLSVSLIFLYAFLERFMPWKPRCALARETVVRRVPDPEGAEIARFAEGLPVRPGAGGRPGGEAGTEGRAAAWVWAEDLREGAGDSEGWIPAEKIIFY